MFSFFNNFFVSKPLQKRTRPNGKRVFFRPKRNDIACLLLVRSRNHCGAPKRNAAYNKTISQSAAVVFILFLILFSFLNVHNHLIRGVEQPLADAGSRTHVHLMVMCCYVAVEPRLHLDIQQNVIPLHSHWRLCRCQTSGPPVLA